LVTLHINKSTEYKGKEQHKSKQTKFDNKWTQRYIPRVEGARSRISQRLNQQPHDPWWAWWGS
jgi:hypothetical protein